MTTIDPHSVEHMTDWDYLTYPEAKVLVTSGFDPSVVAQMSPIVHARRRRAERAAIRRLFGYVPKGWEA